MNSISQDLFYKIRSRFTGLKLGKETGEITIDPMEAAFFDFDYMDGENPIGHVSVSLAEPTSMKVYYSTGITEGMDISQKEGWYNFLKELRQFAKRRLMSFDTRDIAKDNLDKRDYQFLVQNAQKAKQTPVGESIMSESNMYGTSRTSFQKLMDTRLIIKHSKSVDETQAGARARNISALFVENQAGERFKYPFIHLAGARAMQRHVANGGLPYDEIGESIIKMSEEIAQLKSFGNYVVRNDLMNSDNNSIVERSTDALNNLRETLAKLSKQGYYEQYKENFHSGAQLEIPQEVVEDFTEKFTVKNFKEDIKSVFPILYRLMKEAEQSREIGYDDIVEMTTELQVEESAEDRDQEGRDPFDQFEQWALSLGEASSIQSSDDEEKAQAVKALQELVGQHFPAGVDGTNAIESLKGIIDDPKLQKEIKDAAREDSDTCVRPLVKQWLEQNAPDVVQELDFGDMEEEEVEDPEQYANDAADADAVAYGQQGESIEEADAPRQRKPRYKWQSGPSASEFGAPDINIKNPETGKLDYNPAWADWKKSEKGQEYDKVRDTHYKAQQAAKAKHAGVSEKDFDTTLTITNPFFDPNGPEDEEDPNFEYEEIDVGVDYDYDYHGKYYPQTQYEPAEYPELEITINRVVDLDSGEDITKDVDEDAIMKQLEDEVPSWDEVARDRRDQAAIDRWEASRESIEQTDEPKKSMNVQEVAQFIHSFYDKHTKSFPKGPEGVCTMVGKKFGEQAEQIARKFVERMAPHQATEQNPELAELARVKRLAGLSKDQATSEDVVTEYLVQAGDNIGEISGLNLFADMTDDSDMFAGEPEWDAVVQKYRPIADKLKAEIEAQGDRELTANEVEEIESVWYDGSDAYDNAEEAVNYLPRVYDQQIELIQDLLAGNLGSEESQEESADLARIRKLSGI